MGAQCMAAIKFPKKNSQSQAPAVRNVPPAQRVQKATAPLIQVVNPSNQNLVQIQDQPRTITEMEEFLYFDLCFLCEGKVVINVMSEHIVACMATNQRKQKQKQIESLKSQLGDMQMEQIEPLLKEYQKQLQGLINIQIKARDRQVHKFSKIRPTKERTINREMFKFKIQDIEVKTAKNKVAECPLCYTDIQIGEQFITLPCMHSYHKSCSDKLIDKGFRQCIVDKYKLD